MLYVLPLTTAFAGIEHVVHAIAEELATTSGERLDVHVLSSFPHPEITERPVRYTLHLISAERLRGLLVPLVRFFAHNRFDIVVVPQCELSVVCGGALRITNRSALLVTHLHGNPKIEEENSPLVFQIYRRFVLPHVAALLAVSPSLAAYARQHLADRQPVYFAPNPVRQFPIPTRSTPDSPIHRFVSVGRLSRQKGHDVLLRAFAKVHAAVPRATLVIIGNGPEEEALRQLSSTLGLDAHVTFTGYLADPSPYLQSSDCFVLASRWEGFALVLVEAMSLGLPLVATDCEFGPSDIISDDRIGRVARTEDADDLAAAMLAQAATPLRDDDVAYRREKARRFASPNVAGDHLRTITQICAERTMIVS